VSWFREWLYRVLFVSPLVWTSVDKETGNLYLVCNKKLNKKTRNLLEQAWRAGNNYERIKY